MGKYQGYRVWIRANKIKQKLENSHLVVKSSFGDFEDYIWKIIVYRRHTLFLFIKSFFFTIFPFMYNFLAQHFLRTKRLAYFPLSVKHSVKAVIEKAFIKAICFTFIFELGAR